MGKPEFKKSSDYSLMFYLNGDMVKHYAFVTNVRNTIMTTDSYLDWEECNVYVRRRPRPNFLIKYKKSEWPLLDEIPGFPT